MLPDPVAAAEAAAILDVNTTVKSLYMDAIDAAVISILACRRGR